MYTFLFVLLILDAFVLIAAILLQSGKGSGLAASFGGASSAAESGDRQPARGNLLTKAKLVGGGSFVALSFILQRPARRARRVGLDRRSDPRACAARAAAARRGAPRPAGRPAHAGRARAGAAAAPRAPRESTDRGRRPFARSPSTRPPPPVQSTPGVPSSSRTDPFFAGPERPPAPPSPKSCFTRPTYATRSLHRPSYLASWSS
jgi:preprotein translocase subunit SecG